MKKRYFLSDIYNIDRLTTEEETTEKAINKFYNKYGYNPDIIKIIDKLGGTIQTIKDT